METIDVSTQAEFDLEVGKGNRVRVCVGFFVARGNSSVVARGNSSVEAWGNSSVVARGNSSVVAWENSSVEAWENSSVEAWGNSSVEARGNSSVEAWENSSVEAWGNSSVETWENSSVVARGNSSVVARGNSSVVARGNSSVVAWGNSSVVAWEHVFVRLFTALTIVASAHVIIMRHGLAKTLEGGQLVDAFNPSTPAEWCEFHGVTVDDGLATLYKAVDDSFTSPRGICYAPGTLPEAPDWDGGEAECGGGLHFSPHPKMARAFNSDAKRYVGCPVSLDEIVVHPDGRWPEKVKAKRVCRPCFEVDKNGVPVAAA